MATGICKSCGNPAVINDKLYCAPCPASDYTKPPKHTPRSLYRELASAIQARKNCAKLKPLQIDVPDAAGKATRFAPDTYLPATREVVNPEWLDKWTGIINGLVDLLPSGCGIDSGTKIDLDESHANKLVLYTEFHHMDDNGYYDGWTEHTITVTPSFSGINLRIGGPNRNDIKDYLYETFDHALTRDVTYEVFREHYPQYTVTSKWEDKDDTPSQCYQAWYSNGVRFWNDLQGAMNHAADLMEQAFYAPKVGA